MSFGFVEDYPQNCEFDPHNDDSGDDEDDSEFDFCLNKDAETGKFVARWGGREDDKPDAADVQWLRGQLGRLRALAGEVAAGGATGPSSGGQDERRRSR